VDGRGVAVGHDDVDDGVEDHEVVVVCDDDGDDFQGGGV
jgi:hypothetical protein